MPAASTFDITDAVAELAKKPFDPSEFAYELLRIYRGTANSTITKLKAGDTNPANAAGGVLLKNALFFRACGSAEDPAVLGQQLVRDPLAVRHTPRFVVVTNGVDFYAYDTKTHESEHHAFAEDQHWAFFLLPLAPGHDRMRAIEEHPADVRASRLLGRLFDAILKANPTWTAGNHTDALNHLMTRLLFCFYAEDTGIFATKNAFTETMTRHSRDDGADLGSLLDRLFAIMNVDDVDRPARLSPIEAAFPYVNGSLFERHYPVPTFDRYARRQLLDCGNLDWTDINPDIFGSMIQTISDPSERATTGMHYTSVPNILKVLNPLFLDDLRETYAKAERSVARLEALLRRIANIRVFDPACGSGNFLIIAYREIRSLETEILQQIQTLTGKAPLAFSGVSIRNFFGIEIAPFACETARLSLWVAEHKANLQLETITNLHRRPLPLPKIETIRCGNALREDWLRVCPPQDGTETFVCGNPPYVGYQSRSDDQKCDLELAIGPYTPHLRSMDYICGWFIRAGAYAIDTNARIAFVSTNSICQGEQVAMLWPVLFAMGLRIAFAHASFKWANSASRNAGVTCVIVGLTREPGRAARLIDGKVSREVHVIGPYLVPDRNAVIVGARRSPLSDLPALQLGSNPTDGGNLILSPVERAKLIGEFPEARRLVRRFFGANDLVNGIERYCLWIADDEVPFASAIEPIRARIEAVAAARRASPSREIRESAVYPHRFRRRPAAATRALAIPHVVSERRRYLTVTPVPAQTILANSTFAAYDPPPHLLAILSSRMHLIWEAIVGGKLRNDLRYSNTLIYNTFPIPRLSIEQKSVLASMTKAILVARERHPGATLAQLYDPGTMPADLLAAHDANDRYLEEYVYGRKFRDDTHRLELLFEMYARMAALTEPSFASPVAGGSESSR